MLIQKCKHFLSCELFHISYQKFNCKRIEQNEEEQQQQEKNN